MNSDTSMDKYITSDEAGVEQIEHRPHTANDDPCLNPAENVSYGRTGIRGVVASPYVFGAAMLASMGGFSFGYDQSVTLTLIPVVEMPLTLVIEVLSRSSIPWTNSTEYFLKQKVPLEQDS